MSFPIENDALILFPKACFTKSQIANRKSYNMALPNLQQCYKFGSDT